MAYQGAQKIQKVMVQPINLIFRYINRVVVCLKYILMFIVRFVFSGITANDIGSCYMYRRISVLMVSSSVSQDEFCRNEGQPQYLTV